MSVRVDVYASPQVSRPDPGGEQPGLTRDRVSVIGDEPGYATWRSEFMPETFRECPESYAAFVGGLEPALGSFASEVMTANPGFAATVRAGEMPERIKVVGGYCAYSKSRNRLLEPRDGSGSSRIEVVGRDGQSQAVPLPRGLMNAVEFLIANPEPISVPGLMMAAAATKEPTTWIAEVGFYTEWTLDKMMRNQFGEDKPSFDEIERARSVLGAEFERIYARAVKLFDGLRGAVMQEVVTNPTVLVDDRQIRPIFDDAIRDLAASTGFELPESSIPPEVRAAAFYSPAGVRALRSAGGVKDGELVVIAEGFSNLRAPAGTGLAINELRRRFWAKSSPSTLYGEKSGTGDPYSLDRPALLGFAPYTTEPVFGGTDLDYASPYLVPNELNYETILRDLATRLYPKGEDKLPDLPQNGMFRVVSSGLQSPAVRRITQEVIAIAAEKFEDSGVDSKGTWKRDRSARIAEAVGRLEVAANEVLKQVFEPWSGYVEA